MNIHDKGLDFEPIHRVVFGMNQNDFIAGALSFYKDNGITVDSKADDSAQNFTVTGDGDDMFVNLGNAPHSLPVGSVQLYIDSLVDSNPDITVDYIHGEEAVRSLGKGRNCGVLLPAISKTRFFATVSREGVFPRKTFSMGEAFEKRFYMEAKRIRQNMMEEKDFNKSVCIIGSGLSGLTCGMYLARAGFNVSVVEELTSPGGLLSYTRIGREYLELLPHHIRKK